MSERPGAPLSPPRIAGFVATDADVAVILRRGPRDRVLMLQWDLATDRVEEGQWLKAGIELDRCDLSPDGRLFVGAFTDYSPRHDRGREEAGAGWTAISRPPYFTALAFWFDGLARGGLWRDARSLATSNAYRHPERGEIPAWLRRIGFVGSPIDAGTPEHERFEQGRPISDEILGADHGPWGEGDPRWLRSGWVRTRRGGDLNLPLGWQTNPEVLGLLRETTIEVERLVRQRRRAGDTIALGSERWVRTFAGGFLVRHEDWEARDDAGAVHLSLPTALGSWRFLDLDLRGRVLYADGGCLWAWADFPRGEPKLVADLNDRTFRAIPPPTWARTWPSDPEKG